MSRTGIGYLDVLKIADKLQLEGKNPTIDSIREELGTGSRTTIANYLKQWREKRIDGARGSLPQSLSSQVENLYQKLLIEANQKADEEIEKMNIKIKEYQDRLGNITQTSGKLEKALEDYKLNNGLLTQDNEKLTKKLQEREAKCFHLESKVEDCVTRLKERQSQIESLEKQLNQIQSNLEHFRETVATQRQEEKAMHEREVGQLASDIRYLTQQEAKTEQFVSELKQKLENLHQDLRSKDIELNNIIIEHQELQKELIVKTSDLKHVQQSYDILKTEDQNKAYKLLESEKNINNLKIELATLQNKVDILESQSRKNEDAINNLHNAKLFLIQENSELKATLKSFTEAK